MTLLRRAELHGRAQRLLHRHAPAAYRHDPAATARQPVLPAARHPGLAKFLLDLGYNTGEFGKNHLGDHTQALPTAHGFQEFWGYLYHLDAMQGVSFPDINKSSDRARPSCHRARTPRSAASPIRRAQSIPSDGICLMPPRPVIACTSSDGTEAEPNLQGRGAAHPGAIEDSGRGDLGQGHRLPRPQRPQEDQQAVLLLVQSGPHARHDRAARKIHGHGRRARAARTGASTKPA